MTRSTNMEHVEVLRHMKETIKAIAPSEIAALDAAIASLSAPKPPAESAPVGVEVASLPALWRQREDNGEERTEFDKGYEQASDECAEALELALAQQPTARPPKPSECMNRCPDHQVCDHCQWPPGPDQQPAAVDGPVDFEIHAGGEYFASVGGPRERAWKEAMHYVSTLHPDDGEPEVFEVTRRKVALAAQPGGSDNDR